MVYILISILGLIVGSFLSMLSYRFPRGMSILGRSACPKCGKNIEWYRNIPVLYYLVSKGKCGSCFKKISVRYPLIEISTAAFFVLSSFFWLNFGGGLVQTWNLVFGFAALPLFLLLIIFFLLLTIIDLEFQILPDKFLTLLSLLALLTLLLLPSPTLLNNLFFGFLVFMFFLTIYLATRGQGMGFGDVKMSFVLAVFLGFPSILVWLFLSFLSGAVVGLLMIAFGKARFGQHIPFGPFLIVSAWATFFLGDKILQWYLGI